MQEKLNLEARLATLEHFKDWAVNEFIPQVNDNSARTAAMIDHLAAAFSTTATLVQNLAIQQIGEEELKALVADESFIDEASQSLEHFKAQLVEIVNEASMKYKFDRLMKNMFEGMTGEPNLEDCSKCTEVDCPNRRAEFKGESV